MDALARAWIEQLANTGYPYSDDACLFSIVKERAAAVLSALDAPIDMLLFCPNCGEQHIDKVETKEEFMDRYRENGPVRWLNPPHKTHLCRPCGHLWRPSDHCTNGVALLKHGPHPTFGSPVPVVRGQLEQIGWAKIVHKNNGKPVVDSFYLDVDPARRHEGQYPIYHLLLRTEISDAG